MRRWMIGLALLLLCGTVAEAQIGNFGKPATGGAGGAPTDAPYLTRTPVAELTGEQALSLLATGLMFNTTATGAVSIYAGTACTDQFVRSLTTAGVAVCGSIALADLGFDVATQEELDAICTEQGGAACRDADTDDIEVSVLPIPSWTEGPPALGSCADTADIKGDSLNNQIYHCPDGAGSDPINMGNHLPYFGQVAFGAGQTTTATIANQTLTLPGQFADINLFEHFLGSSTETGEIGDYGWGFASAPTGMTVSRLTAIAGRPGLFRIDTTASINTQSHIFLGTGLLLPSEMFDMTFWFRINQTTLEEVRVGLVSESTTPPANGIYVEYDTASATSTTNFVCVTRASSVSTPTDTTIAVTNTAWNKIRIYRADASTIKFLINDVERCSHTATIPTASLYPAFVIENLEAASKTMDVDKFHLRITGLAD